MVASVVAKRGDVIQTGWHGPAACAGVEFLDAHAPGETGRAAAERAVTMLDSIPAPAGEMPVVVANGCGGVLFHEAVGHPLEADAVDKEASVYRGLVGTRCASELINGVDDATIANGWGSFDFDDEGEPGARTVLFTDGVLQGFLQDRMRAAKMDVATTGNARRESYAYPPIPRMTNTNILPGATAPADVVGGTERGIYVTGLAGGQVNPATGDFVFGVSEGFLIEGGKISTPVRGANLIGRAIEVMSQRGRGRVGLRDLGGRVRQGRPGGARRQRLAHAPDRSGSPWGAPVAELHDLVQLAIGAAESGEQIEAYAEEGRETEVSRAPRRGGGDEVRRGPGARRAR